MLVPGPDDRAIAKIVYQLQCLTFGARLSYTFFFLKKKTYLASTATFAFSTSKVSCTDRFRIRL